MSKPRPICYCRKVWGGNAHVHDYKGNHRYAPNAAEYNAEIRRLRRVVGAAQWWRKQNEFRAYTPSEQRLVEEVAKYEKRAVAACRRKR